MTALNNCSGKCVYGYYSFPFFRNRFAIGDNVIYHGKKTQIIAFIAHLNKYLVAGFGEQVSLKILNLIMNYFGNRNCFLINEINYGTL
jgi:hypothetical protein